MPKITIIVPIYNNAKFLNRCLKSIINQSYDDLEVLLIDDGSTDNSLAICEKYKKQDKRVRVLYQNHQGVSAARNKGIDNATGDYLCFVDSDDRLATDYCKHMMQLSLIYQADIMIGFFGIWGAQDHQYYVSFGLQPYDFSLDGVYSSRQWLSVWSKYSKKLATVPFVLWGKLFKKDLFRNIREPLNFKIGEDFAITWQLYLRANRIAFRNIRDYVYTDFKPDSLHAKYNSNANDVIVDQQRIALYKTVGIPVKEITDDLKGKISQKIDQRIISQFNQKIDNTHRY